MDIVVLISGRGSNLEALLRHQDGYQVKHVISNNLKARGLEVAQSHGVQNTFLRWDHRENAEKRLAQIIQAINPDLIVLAGFMRILSPSLIQLFHNKIINIHPSLLPKYPGLNTHDQVLLSQDKYHGASVHLVDEQLDNGLILSQTRFEIQACDDAESLANKLILKEHKLLTITLGLIASGKLKWTEQQLTMNKKSRLKPIYI